MLISEVAEKVPNSKLSVLNSLVSTLAVRTMFLLMTLDLEPLCLSKVIAYTIELLAPCKAKTVVETTAGTDELSSKSKNANKEHIDIGSTSIIRITG